MQGVIGAFAEIDATVHAVEDLRKQNFADITVFTPTPRHEFEDALASPKSSVRRFTLVGGLLGLTFGYWIPIWISDYWPLVVGGKPIASWVPYTIFGFEVMVLVGSLAACVVSSSATGSRSGSPTTGLSSWAARPSPAGFPTLSSASS